MGSKEAITCTTCGRTKGDPDALICSNPFHLDLSPMTAITSTPEDDKTCTCPRLPYPHYRSFPTSCPRFTPPREVER